MLTNLRRRITLILSVTILIVLAFSTASAQDTPQIPPEKPSCYYGAVLQNGSNVTGEVSVWIGTTQLASSHIKEGSVYVLKATGGSENDPVIFLLNGILANTSIENPTYLSGVCINIDLSLITEIPESILFLPLITK